MGSSGRGAGRRRRPLFVKGALAREDLRRRGLLATPRTVRAACVFDAHRFGAPAIAWRVSTRRLGKSWGDEERVTRLGELISIRGGPTPAGLRAAMLVGRQRRSPTTSVVMMRSLTSLTGSSGSKSILFGLRWPTFD